MEEEYKSNSYKSRQKEEQNKKVEKVTKKPAKRRKKNEVQKFAEVFMPEDVGSVRNYIFEDVLIPAIKEVLLEAVQALLGLDGNRSRKSSSGSRVSYRSYYDNKESKGSSYHSLSRHSGFDYDDIICESRGDAEEILDRMMELIDRYGQATVADLYDLADVSGPYTNNRYGWEDKDDILDATIARLRKDEYLIKLPRPKPLN